MIFHFYFISYGGKYQAKKTDGTAASKSTV